MSGAGTPRTESRSFAAAELLSIDVDAELEALCEAQLHGPWQVPAELVRHALRIGAREVDVRVRRGGLVVRWSGAAVEPTVLRLLRTALDQHLPAATRHRAIVELEAAGAQALLWAAGLPGGRIEISSSEQEQALELEHQVGARPRLEAAEARPGDAATLVRVSGVRLEAAKAADWVRSSCRFAPVAVTVDGTRVWQHIAGALYRARIQSPLPGQLWVAAGGEAPCLWLLQHGVLSTRATVPGYPPFHAVLEMGGLLPQPSSSAALREEVTPHLVELVDQAAAMLVRIGRGLPGLEEAPRRRVTELLLRCARRGMRREDVSALPLIQALEPGNQRPCWLSIADIEKRLEPANQGVFAVGPDRRRDAFVSGGATVVVVTTEERGLIEEIVGRDLEQPPPSRRGSVAPRLRRAVQSAGSWLPAAAWAVVTGGRRDRAIKTERLTVGERCLLEALATGSMAGADRRCDAVICEGNGAVRRGAEGSQRLVLPRHNPLVKVCARLLGRDPSWTYPVLLAVLGSRGEPPADCRSRWVRLMLGGSKG